jgi:hypothetical protein
LRLSTRFCGKGASGLELLPSQQVAVRDLLAGKGMPGGFGGHDSPFLANEDDPESIGLLVV